MSTQQPAGSEPEVVGSPGTTAAQLPPATTSTDVPDGVRRALSVLRSRGYVALLLLGVVIGVPVSAAAYGFLALVHWLQQALFTQLPNALGMPTAPIWWPMPLLAMGGLLTGLAIRYLPGDGGPSPAGGFALHPPPSGSALPGVVLAALASLGFGAVVGPELPIVALGGGLAVLALKAVRRPMPAQARAVVGATGSFAAISTLLGSPLTSAFLVMEAAGLGGLTMDVVLVPGLLAAGIVASSSSAWAT